MTATSRTARACALALALLVSSFLLLTSFSRLERVDPGFSAEEVLTFRVTLPRDHYPTPLERGVTCTLVLDRDPSRQAAGALP